MSTADGDGDLILHRWPRAWGLPSLSPECVAVEAYLRLAHLRFSAEDCRTPYASPSGTLPALDQCADVVGGVEGKDEHGQRDNHGAVAARRITTHLARKVANLDAHVRDASDRSALAAYLALVEARLARATAYFTWVDRDRFYAHTRREYGRAFPPPLSYIIPWLWRRQMLPRFAGESSDAVVAGAADAYAALARRLEDAGGAYFMGPKPTSVDALAFAHLAFHALSPVGDALRRELAAHPSLVAYVERMRAALFPSEETGLGGRGGASADDPNAIDASGWLEPPTEANRARRGWWGYGRGGSGSSRGEPKKPKKPRSAKEERFRRRSRYSVLIAVAAVLAYLLTGEVVEFAFGDEEEDAGEAREASEARAVGGGGDADATEPPEESLDDDDEEDAPPGDDNEE